jgi:hypothetical protein
LKQDAKGIQAPVLPCWHVPRITPPNPSSSLLRRPEEDRAMKLRTTLIAAAAILGAMGAYAYFVISAQTPETYVRKLLSVETGCYPVGYNGANDKIVTLCRGNPEWSAEALQWFNSLNTDSYFNKYGVLRWQSDDLREQVGPGPYMQYYLGEMDKLKIPHPAQP